MSDAQAASHVKGLALRPVQQFLLYDAIDVAPALVFVADDHMNYLAVNNRACEVLGYSREELLSMCVTDVATSVEAPELFREMMNEGSHEGAVDLRTKDGELLPFIYQASETTIAGMPYWISVGFVDSKLLRLRPSAADAQRIKDRLIALTWCPIRRLTSRFRQ